MHLACQSLRTGESPLAIAAGVNVILQPHITVAYSQSGMMAPDGRCKFGDADGDGYVRSEGVGVLLLKRSVGRDRADGDPIHAVIRGSAVNNDGRGSGHLATPSREGQAAMLRDGVRERRRRRPSSVAATSKRTAPARASAIRSSSARWATCWPEGRDAAARCLVGSVKTNIGHTEGAAGMAGLIKCDARARARRNPGEPASAHAESGGAVERAAIRRFLNDRSPWPRGTRRAFAGVSAFGIAGTNAHVVLEEAPARIAAPPRS